MPVLNFSFDKLFVEKKESVKSALRVDTNLKVKDVKKEKIKTDNKGKSLLRFDFVFSLNYTPKIAGLELEGHMIYGEDNKKIEKIIKEWKKSKKIDPEVMAEIINIALLKCNIKSLILAQDVGLPPHIKLPIVLGPKKVKKKKSRAK